MDLIKKALKYHQKNKGKIATQVLSPIGNKSDLSLAYTPGVGEVSRYIAKNPETVFDYTIKSHTVAVVTDGSAVLGLGNIGPEAALPVMEGKCALFKTFANIDAFPICLNTQNSKEIIQIVKAIAPSFGGINLEDIAAPRCFEIEAALQTLGIPVMHDDQHGTAVVTLAGLINASKVARKDMQDIKVVISGAGAAGSAVARLILNLVKDVLVVDSKGVISEKRSDLDPYKKQLATITNGQGFSGTLQQALIGADVFIGVSAPNILKASDIKVMAQRPIVFAMANPIPEIMPDEAQKGGVYIMATGRSDFPNQINNSLAFPGIFKGALQKRATQITEEMKIKAALALAGLVKNPTQEKIIPGPFDLGVTKTVAKAVSSCA
jgi:malate dehydrogenase (oxaloacetate-decarboxylating)